MVSPQRSLRLERSSHKDSGQMCGPNPRLLLSTSGVSLMWPRELFSWLFGRSVCFFLVAFRAGFWGRAFVRSSPKRGGRSALHGSQQSFCRILFPWPLTRELEEVLLGCLARGVHHPSWKKRVMQNRGKEMVSLLVHLIILPHVHY